MTGFMKKIEKLKTLWAGNPGAYALITFTDGTQKHISTLEVIEPLIQNGREIARIEMFYADGRSANNNLFQQMLDSEKAITKP